MKLLLNDADIMGQDNGVALDPAMPLGRMLLSVQEQCLGQDDIIASITVDDEELSSERFSELKERPCSDFQETRIVAKHRNNMAASGLRGLKRSLEQSRSDREWIVWALREGQVNEGTRKLLRYLQLWNLVQQSMASACRLMEVDPDTIVMADEMAENTEQENPRAAAPSVSERIHLLGSELQQIKAALENNDFVLLSDVLCYEFPLIQEQWEVMLESLADTFEGQVNQVPETAAGR